MWAEDSSSATHLLHSGLSTSPITWRCLRRVLCPVSNPVITLDCALVKDRSPTPGPRRGPEISSRACIGNHPGSAIVSGVGPPTSNEFYVDDPAERPPK